MLCPFKNSKVLPHLKSCVQKNTTNIRILARNLKATRQHPSFKGWMPQAFRWWPSRTRPKFYPATLFHTRNQRKEDLAGNTNNNWVTVSQNAFFAAPTHPSRNPRCLYSQPLHPRVFSQNFLTFWTTSNKWKLIGATHPLLSLKPGILSGLHSGIDLKTTLKIDFKISWTTDSANTVQTNASPLRQDDLHCGTFLASEMRLNIK